MQASSQTSVTAVATAAPTGSATATETAVGSSASAAVGLGHEHGLANSSSSSATSNIAPAIMVTLDAPIAFAFLEALMRKLRDALAKDVRSFVGHRFEELKANIKARFRRVVEQGGNFHNKNKELRKLLASLGHPQASRSQIGTVSPMRVCSQSKPKYYNATTGKWDRQDPRCNGAG